RSAGHERGHAPAVICPPTSCSRFMWWFCLQPFASSPYITSDVRSVLVRHPVKIISFGVRNAGLSILTTLMWIVRVARNAARSMRPSNSDRGWSDGVKGAGKESRDHCPVTRLLQSSTVVEEIVLQHKQHLTFKNSSCLWEC